MISGHTYINRYKMLLLKIIGTFLKEFCYKLQAEVVDGPKAHHKETWWRNDDISNSVHNTRPPFCWGITFSHTCWKGGVGKNECLGGGRKSSCHRFLSGGLLALHISYTIYFSFVQVLVQGLLLKGLLKVMTSLKDVTRCYCNVLIYKKKIRLFLTGLFSLI